MATDFASQPSPAPSATGDLHEVHHETAVAEIVSLILGKFSEEGERSFAIGKRAYEHALWLKWKFPDYQSADFNSMVKQIRESVSDHIPIKAESIRVSDWVRCHVLRELCRDVIADLADQLSMNEYRAIVGKALSFSTKDLTGHLNLGWLDMIREIATNRISGGRVSRKDFDERVAATIQHIATLMAADARTAKKAALSEAKAKRRAAKKTQKALTKVLSEGIANEHVSPEHALSILYSVAKQHGKPMSRGLGGFNPAECTERDCDLLASTMFAAGKFAEIVQLQALLTKIMSSAGEILNADRYASIAS